MRGAVEGFCVAATAAGCVWVLRDADGYVTVGSADATRTVMPFWSSRAGAATVTRRAPAARDLVPEPVDLEAFTSRWLPGLARDATRVGVDWTGVRSGGGECEPDELVAALARAAAGAG
ncbi:DUF2750 domain-containing protein [Cellulomonas sp. JZ18]|uniref:DUF2750 domain-containing protein n=1 Tax=Cellulomonas sp. JZ18 TaxID=2654191 RepID=UPI0012D47961|nr:DUF2750 domain-containing protein [Cellulomonas sp. JZ18]QGQ19718.1 DUF2750 domain-containing protein [Cellulomonas sp. JZ18]